MSFIDWITGRSEPFPMPAAKPVYANGIREATQEQLTESVYGMELVDPDANLTAAQGGSLYYRRLSAGTRDLAPLAWDKALKLAYGLWDGNPLAKRIIDMTRDFAVGDGITVTANVRPHVEPDEPDADDEQARARLGEQRKRAQAEAEQARAGIQRVIDRFWNDSLNRLDLKLPQKVADLGLAGELYIMAFVNERNGHVRLGTIDPERVEDIVRNPQNAEELWEVVLKAPGAAEKPRLKVIRVNEDPQAASFGRMVGVLPGELAISGDAFVGACFAFAINKPSVAKRGRSDLLTIIDWVDGYDQLLFGEMDRMELMKTFIWDVEMKGKSDIQIAEYAKLHGAAPKRATVRYHNENSIWNAVAPDLKMADVATGADLLLSHIATGAGLPKTWLNGMMDVNRASATEMSEPAIRHLAQRQKYIGYIVEQFVVFQLDQAELAIVLPKRPTVEGDVYPEPWPITINTPEFRAKDLAAAGATLQAVATAIATGLADKVIDVDAAQEIFVAMAGQLGVELDLEDLRERLKLAAAEEPAPAAPGADIEDEVDAIIASYRGNGRG